MNLYALRAFALSADVVGFESRLVRKIFHLMRNLMSMSVSLEVHSKRLQSLNKKKNFNEHIVWIRLLNVIIIIFFFSVESIHKFLKFNLIY